MKAVADSRAAAFFGPFLTSAEMNASLPFEDDASHPRQVVRAYLKRAVDFVLRSDDFGGELKRYLATAISRIGVPDAEASMWPLFDALPESAKGGWPRIDRSLAIFRDFPPIDINDLEFHRDRVTLSDLKELNRAAEAAVAGDPVALAGCRADMGDPLAASARINEMIVSAIVLDARCGERRGPPP
jgi:hypothetical protein